MTNHDKGEQISADFVNSGGDWWEFMKVIPVMTALPRTWTITVEAR
jgi:hypothetical protein